MHGLHNEDIAQADECFLDNAKDHGAILLGHTVVKVYPSKLVSGAFIAHCEGRVHFVEFNTGSSDLSPSVCTRIIVPQTTDEAWDSGLFLAIAPVLGDVDLDDRTNTASADVLFCLDETSAYITKVDRSKGLQLVPRSRRLDGAPTRLASSKKSGDLIVLSHERQVVTTGRWTPMASMSPGIAPGIRTLDPVITFLGLDQKFLHGSEMAPRRSSRNRNNDDPLLRGEVRPHSKAGEIFLGITQWFPRVRGSAYPMLVVNTMIKADADRPAAGRLIIYLIISSGDMTDLNQIKEVPCSSPVYSVAIHPDERVLFYSTALSIGGVRLESDGERLKLRILPAINIDSSIRYMEFVSGVLYASTFDNSVYALTLDGDTLSPELGDIIPRPTTHHMVLDDDPEEPDSLILVADMAKNVAGLWRSVDTPISQCMTTVFEATDISDSIIRLLPLSRPLVYNKVTNEERLRERMPWSCIPRVAALGVGTTGVFTQLQVLKPHQWPLLRFIQDLAKRSPIIAPFSHEKARMPPLALFESYVSDLEDTCKSTLPADRHIKGDVLRRLLERGETALLLQLLGQGASRGLDSPKANETSATLTPQQPPQSSSDPHDTMEVDSYYSSPSSSHSETSSVSDVHAKNDIVLAGTVEERWRCFVALAMQALELESASDFEPDNKDYWLNDETGKENIILIVLSWIEALLRPLP